MTDRPFFVQLQIGLGADNTIALSLVSPAGVVASWSFNEVQAQQHIEIMERHLIAVKALNARPQPQALDS